MPKRANLGLDRRPYTRSGHRGDLHQERDKLRICIVCQNIGRWPCSSESLELMRAELG